MAYTEEQIKTLKDMRAFLDYCMTFGDVKFEEIMNTFLHDAGGIIRGEKCMAPRTVDFDAKRPVWEHIAADKGLEVKR